MAKKVILSAAAACLAATTAVHAQTCSDVPRLQDDFTRLTQAVALNRQVLDNFGFDKSAEEIERLQNLPAVQIGEGMKGFRKLLFDETMKEARAKLMEQARGLATDAALPAVQSGAAAARDAQFAREHMLATKFREIDPDLGQRMRMSREIIDGLDDIDKLKTAYDVADPLVKSEMLESALNVFNTVATKALEGGVGKLTTTPASASWVGTMLSVDEWAWAQAYQSGKAVYMVSQMLKASDGDLQLLKTRTKTLNALNDSLRAVNKSLAALGPKCSSLNMVRKPSGGGSAGPAIVGAVIGLGGAAYLAGVAAKNAANNKSGTSSSSGNAKKSGQCTGLSPANACGACTCTQNVDCVDSPQCGGSGSCWYSSRPAPFC